MHVDIWTPNANQFGIQLVSLDNGGTQASQVNFLPTSGKITTNGWVSLDIPLGTALSDSVYALPDTFVAEGGGSWIEHWAITMGKPPLSEPSAPKDMQERAAALPHPQP